jgi:hypothetical membrane protein
MNSGAQDGGGDGTTAFPARITPWVVVGAACWTLTIAFFVVQAIAQAASARPFSLATNLISDLGNTACGPTVCSPLHGLVNATFIGVGLLHWAGAAATWRAWPAARLSRIGLVLLALAGWGLAYAGVFPENVAPDMHRFGALIGLVSLNVSMFLLGWVLLKAAGALGVPALLAGLVGLVALAPFLSGVLTGAPWLAIGISERLADYPAAAMVVVIGAFILVRAVGSPGQARLSAPGGRSSRNGRPDSAPDGRNVRNR